MSATRFILLLFAVASISAAFALTSIVRGDVQPSMASLLDVPGTQIVVLGDTGTGGEGQYKVKAAFRQVCADRGCDLAMINGDLIYETGVSSAYDPQFDTKFEQPYADVAMTFYLTLGNHDNSDDRDQGIGTDAGKGEHQVAYHYRNDTSGKWYLPARYYNVRVGDVELFSLDTNTMMSYGIVRSGLDPLATAAANDPLMVEQINWVEDAIAASNATWKIAFGHHPLYSNGEHGDAGESDGVPPLALGVKNFLEQHVCDRVDFYLAGHDHDLQWLHPNPSCGDTQLLVSGASAKTRQLNDPTRNPAYFQRGGTLGFWWLELRDSEFTAAAYDADGNLLFEQRVVKPL